MKYKKYQNPSGPIPVSISTDYRNNLQGIPEGTVFGYTPELGLHYEEPITPENIETASPGVQQTYKIGQNLIELENKRKEKENKRKKELKNTIKKSVEEHRAKTEHLGDGDSATD